MTRLLSALLLPVAWCAVCSAQIKWNSAYQQYIDQYKDIAIEQMRKHRIPASITLAQGVFESGAGRSYLARQGNNHFGIKCHDWSGRTVYYDDDARDECFRAYRNAYESYEDHSRFLTSSPRYKRLFSLRTDDYKGWARGLKACGYATNPAYAQKLIDIIELYGLNKYDTGKGYDRFIARLDRDARPDGGGLPPVYEFGGNYYLRARAGDTFQSIARQTGRSSRALAKYNERDRRDPIEEGEMIWLKKKASRAPKSYKGRPHTVRAGESMYSIAQLYGIRLKKLYKMNRMSPDDGISVGDKLRIY